MSEPTRTPPPSRTPASANQARGGGEDHNIVDLVGRLTQQGAHLAREQVSLMQAEVRESATEVKAVVGSMAAAAVFGIAGLGVLLMGISYYVGAALEDVPLGTTLVGIVTLVIGLILYAGARKKVSATSLKPSRSIDTITDTPAAVTGDHLNSGAR
jgi:hypothetical protein